MVRFKNRYLLVEILWEKGPGRKAGVNSTLVFRSIRDAVSGTFGSFGNGIVSNALTVKYFDEETSMAIVRTPRDGFRLVWGAISLLTDIGSHRCAVRVLHVGSTIRSCQKKAIEYSNESAHVALAFGEAVAAAAANDDDDDDVGGDDDDDNGNNNGGGNSGSAGNANLADMVATSTS